MSGRNRDDVRRRGLGRRQGSITVRATGRKAGYADGSSTSNAIAPALNAAPTARTPVSLSGTGVVGSAVVLTAPVWDVDGVTTTYEWFKDGTSSRSPGRATRWPAATSARRSRSRRRRPRRATRNGTTTSNAIRAGLAPASAPLRAPAVTGAPVAKQTLTADRATGRGPAPSRTATSGWSTASRWRRRPGKTFGVRTQDAGHTVAVAVTMTTAGAAPSTATSAGVTVAKLAAHGLGVAVLEVKITAKERRRS